MKLASLSTVGLVLLLGGCRAVGPDYQRPDPPQLAAAFPSGDRQRKVDARWWENFHDSSLNRLIQTARHANLDVAQAEARLREARALARAGESGAFLGELRNSTAVAGWEADLFGKIRRTHEATQASVESAEALRDAALVSVSSEVATAYLELRGSQQATVWTNRSLEQTTRLLQLSRTAENLGSATRNQSNLIEKQLADLRANLAPLRQTQEIALARLALLCGQAPGTLDASLARPAPVPFVPNSVAVGLPMDLLRNRPDVRAAERDLAVAVAGIGIETAELYPHFALAGMLSYSVGKPSGLLWDLGPNVSWAAFSLPKVRANIDAARARADGALARYRQSVLQANTEAVAALSTWRNQRERGDQLRYAAALARSEANDAQRRLDAGVLTLPEVLVAEQSRGDAEIKLAEAETLTITSLVSVYQALGGGWQENLPIP